MKHLRLIIHGNVQGVFFRASAQRKAEELGIFGYAKNQKNGCVYVEVEGETGDVDEFLAWCYEGPEMAEVTEIEITEKGIKKFSKFSIR